MAQGMAQPNYARTAHILALIGGIFIVIDGLLTLAVASLLAGALAGLGYGAFGALVAIFGAIGFILGLIILYGAVQLRRNPASTKTWGILLIVLSLVSYIGGGGFFIGLILVLIGGILALTWHPPAAAAPGGQWNQPQPGTWGQPTGAPPLQQSAPAPGAGQRFCASCGSPNAPGATFCAKCGAPLSP